MKFNSMKAKTQASDGSEKIITLEKSAEHSRDAQLSKDVPVSEFFNDLDEVREEVEEDAKSILERLSDTTIDMYRVFPSSTVVGSSLITAAERLHQEDQLMIFEQDGFDENKSEATNFIYLLGLPYDLTTKTNTTLKYEIAESLASIGEVKSVRMYSYKDFLSVLTGSKQIPIPKNVANYFDVPITEYASLEIKNRGAIPWTEDVYYSDSLQVLPEESTLLELKEPNTFSHQHNSIKVPLPVKYNEVILGRIDVCSNNLPRCYQRLNWLNGTGYESPTLWLKSKTQTQRKNS